MRSTQAYCFDLAADTESFRVPVDNEGTETFVPLLLARSRTGPCKHQIRVCDFAVCDEHFSACNLPLATVEFPRCLDPCDVGSSAGFSHRVSAELVPRDNREQVLFLLLLRPPIVDWL